MSDPYRGYNFFVELDGLTTAGFQECTGLDNATAPVDYREGTDPAHVRKLTGLNTVSPVTLKRGITDSTALWEWRQRVMAGDTDRHNISVVLRNEKHEEKWRWDLFRAWPSKWTGPSFNSTSNEVAVETLEITFEELKKA
ncbi:MAG: phage tail protein [Cyanobacteria bacterium P01_F01_bin.150]